MYLSIPSPLDPLGATDQFEDTQVEVSVDRTSSYFTILVTSGGSSSAIQSVVDVPRTGKRQSLFRARTKMPKGRSELIRPLSPINSNRSCALDDPIYRKRSESHSLPPPRRRRRNQDDPDSASVATTGTSSTASRQHLFVNHYHNDHRGLARRELSCPPALRQLLSDDTEVIGNGKSSNSSASSVILQEPDFSGARSKKPDLVSATASRQGIILRNMRGARRKIMPSPSNSSMACVF